MGTFNLFVANILSYELVIILSCHEFIIIFYSFALLCTRKLAIEPYLFLLCLHSYQPLHEKYRVCLKTDLKEMCFSLHSLFDVWSVIDKLTLYTQESVFAYMSV